MKNVGYYWEKSYPFLLALGSSVLYKFYGKFTCLTQDFDKVLDGAITFSSIIVGFIGALLAILISIREQEIVKFIYAHIKKNLLLRYFKETIITGLLVVVLSTGIYLIKDQRIACNITLIWLFVSVYFIFSSYRAIDILLRIVFKDPNATEKIPQGNQLPDDTYDDLKKKCSL